MTSKAATFADFVGKFPSVTMPVTLGETSHHAFSTENDPLSEAEIVQFILPAEGIAEQDEFTEYVPCFSIAGTESLIALVWWKAALLQYDYSLATFTAKGELIDRKVIAHTQVENGGVSRAVVHINEEWEMTILEGSSPDGDLLFDGTSSRTRYLELMANGEII